jgi:hypothetical protein
MAEVEPINALEHAQESFLREVLGVLVRGDEVPGHAVGASLVAFDEASESGFLAAERLTNERVVNGGFGPASRAFIHGFEV